MKISITEAEENPEAAEILANLKEYNMASIGPANRQGLTISLKESSGALAGGLVGYTHWS